MKRLAFILPLLALAACSPQGMVTAQHWRDYTAHPDIGHSGALFHDLRRCKDSTCPAMADISDQMVDDLTTKVSSNDLDPIHVATSVYPLVANRGPVSVRLARRIATIIDDQPETYLDVAVQDGVASDIVLATPAAMMNSDRDRYSLLRARRHKLIALSLTDPDMIAAQQHAVAILNHAIIQLDGQLNSGQARPATPAP